MGNLCSIVLRGIEYVLRFIFPRYTAMMLEGYNPVSDEHDRPVLINNVCSTPQISVSVSNPGYERRDRVEEQQENVDQISPEEDNTEYIRSIVNDFFTIHNLQKQALTKNITDKFFDLGGKVNNISSANIITKSTDEKEIRDFSSSTKRQIHPTNSKSMSSSEKITKETASNENGKTRVLNASLSTEDKENDSYLANKMGSIGISDCRKSKYLIESAKINMKCIENPEYRLRKCGVVPPEEIFQEQKPICASSTSTSKEISSNDHSKDGCDSGTVPSGKIIQDQKDLFKNSGSSSGDLPPNSDSDDEYAHDVEVGKNKKLSLRKISLNKLYSGSHYAVINNEENVDLSDYSGDFPPLQVEAGICYENFTRPKLSSGGTAVFQELSDHLSIPNWYDEEPIFYSEISDGIKAPQSSPIMLQQVEPSTFSRSSSGGGIVTDSASQKVYLPDLFPSSSGPLSQTYYPMVNTQSSTSFGELQTLKDKTREIFTDLLKESIAHDTKLASKLP